MQRKGLWLARIPAPAPAGRKKQHPARSRYHAGMFRAAQTARMQCMNEYRSGVCFYGTDAITFEPWFGLRKGDADDCCNGSGLQRGAGASAG
jgi:hypothetical protein